MVWRAHSVFECKVSPSLSFCNFLNATLQFVSELMSIPMDPPCCPQLYLQVLHNHFAYLLQKLTLLDCYVFNLPTGRCFFALAADRLLDW